MRITIIGTGYVGLVTGACFAEMGNKVSCVDKDSVKIKGLKNGIIPIFEPGLKAMVNESYQKGVLAFTTSLQEAINESDIVFISVGTSQNEDGSADLTHVLNVAKEIGKEMNHPLIVVDKSTVPVGTAEKVRESIQTELNSRKENIDFDVVSNPEFLKEGSAIKDFMQPDRVVIGSENENSTINNSNIIINLEIPVTKKISERKKSDCYANITYRKKWSN